VGELGGNEVIVRVDDRGNVAVHFTLDFSREPLVLSVEMSAWAIDTHSQNNLLAIGANTHIISIFHLGMGVEGMKWTSEKPFSVIYPRLDLKGHEHNIPTVAFDKRGEYLASGSIDKTVRLWSCITGSCLKVIMGDKQYEP
jgi:WD40 repeat protein